MRLDWLMVSDDLVAADRVACRLMGIDENDVDHFRSFRDAGWWGPLEAARTNRPIDELASASRFHLRRAWTDLPGLACFNNAALAWIGYRSPLAGLLHKLLYLFREPFYDYEAESSRVRDAGSKLDS